MAILVVDDCEEGRAIFRAVLEDAGFSEVVTAESAAAAFMILAVNVPTTAAPIPVDLVLLDALMSEVDGFTACKYIRSDIRYADVPIAIVTSLDDMMSIDIAFNSGATSYITKPLKRADLIACVRSSLNLKEERAMRAELKRELMHHKPFRF
jgi:phosphoserine phosphatase RsbU/P